MSKDAFNRRSFLKGAAASAAAVLGTQLAANAPVEGAQSDSESGEKPASRDKIIGRPGSDYMVDVIKATGMEYIASNPGSSFRSLQESIINYGGNKKPEFSPAPMRNLRWRWRMVTPRCRASRWGSWRMEPSAYSTRRWRSTTLGATAFRS